MFTFYFHMIYSVYHQGIVMLSTDYTQYVHNFSGGKIEKRALWITFFILYFVVILLIR